MFFSGVGLNFFFYHSEFSRKVFPDEGIEVLEGRGKGPEILPRGYPCHSLNIP